MPQPLRHPGAYAPSVGYSQLHSRLTKTRSGRSDRESRAITTIFLAFQLQAGVA